MNATRVVRVVDTTPPTLTIKGSNPATVEAGTPTQTQELKLVIT